MAVYWHNMVVYTGTDPTDAQTISASFSTGTGAAYWDDASVSDAVEYTFSPPVNFKPGTNYKVHYVVLDDSSATAAASTSYTIAPGMEGQTPPARRRTNPKLRM